MDTSKYYPRTALFLLTALNLLNYLDRYILPAVQTQIQDEFHISSEKIGLVTTAFIWCYVLAAPLVGPLADRFSRKWIVVAGGALWSVATLLTAVTPAPGRVSQSAPAVPVGAERRNGTPWYNSDLAIPCSPVPGASP